MRNKLYLAAAAVLLFSGSVFSDTVVLQSGDTLHGKIGQVTGNSLKLNSPDLGEITISISKVTSYKFDAPTRIELKDDQPTTGTVSGDSKSVTINDKTYGTDKVKNINPPAEDWTGSIIANGAIARGNTNKFTAGVEGKAELRRDNYLNNDRLTFTGAYNYGTSGTGEGLTVDTDNWLIAGKYDRFWTDKLYGYTSGKLEHDNVAQLYYRITPGVGLGYQWIETGTMKFSTEAGVSFIHEAFEDQESSDNIAARLAYRFEKQVNERIQVFHNLEFLPAFDDPADYILNTDLGLRASLTATFFTQMKIELKRDSKPADDALKNDLLYTIGVGWSF